MTLDFEDRNAEGERAEPGQPATNGSDTGSATGTRRLNVRAGVRRLVEAIMRSDDEAVERAVMQLSAKSRWLARTTNPSIRPTATDLRPGAVA